MLKQKFLVVYGKYIAIKFLYLYAKNKGLFKPGINVSIIFYFKIKNEQD